MRQSEVLLALLMQMIFFIYCSNNLSSLNLIQFQKKKKNLFPFSMKFLDDLYNNILETNDDAETQITLKTIELMTKLYGNFVKYG